MSFEHADGKLKRIDIDSGSMRVLANGAGRGGAWRSDGTILFAPTLGSLIFRLSPTAGDPVAVTRFEAGHGTHRFPQFLPDGRHFDWKPRP